MVNAEGSVDYFETEAEALKAAASETEYCLDGGEWSAEVTNIRIARVTHDIRQINTVTKDMLVDGEYNGRFYDGDADYWCEYEMVRVG